MADKNNMQINSGHKAGQKFWFRRKTYGWGWTPVTWQGWLVVLFYVVAALALALFGPLKDESDPNGKEIILFFMLPLSVLVGSLIFVSYKKGESPRWQWGRDKKE